MTLPFLSGRSARGGSFAAGPAAPASGGPQVTRQSDLSHWWKLDDLTDSTGNGATLTLENHSGVFDTDAVNGKSVALDGTDEHITSGTTVNLGGDGTVMSASLWIKSTSVLANPETRYDGGYNEFFGFGTADNAPGLGFSVGVSPYYTSYHDIRMRVDSTSKYYYANFSTFSDIPADLREWHHWAWTWVSGGGVKVYVNGALQHTTADITGTIANISNCYVRIGRNFLGSQCIPAKFDDVRLYGIELSVGEVSSIYGGGDGDWV